jgi:hypothetical protein
MTENSNNTNINPNTAAGVASIVKMCEKMITDAVARLNDLNAVEKQCLNEKIENSVKRLDDLNYIQVKRLEDNLTEHKLFNKTFNESSKENLDRTIADRDVRLAQKFDSLDKAITKAEVSTENRFQSVNEFRAVLTSQQATLLPRLEYDSGHKNLSELVASSVKTLSDTIVTQKERIDKIDNQKSGGQNLWVIIVGAVALVSAMFSIALHFVK